MNARVPESEIHEVREALVARAHTATLDELREQGKRRVRVIRADDVAQMIEEAVGRVVAKSGLVSPDEAQQLIERSQSEFKQVLAQRQAEMAEAQRLREELAAAKDRVEPLRERVQELEAELEHARDTASKVAPAAAAALAELPPESVASLATGANADLVYRLMSEVAELKARAGQGAAPGKDSSGDSLASALEQLTSTFTSKLEMLGRKMGVSSAVESKGPDLKNLFAHNDDVKLESNIDSVKLNTKAASGIAANLERLKKLKGGG